MSAGQQIIKTREDHAPVVLEPADDEQKAERIFCLSDKCECSWAKPNEKFGVEKLRQRIEPWLTALVQSDYISLLIGSGLSHAVHWIATGESAPGMNGISFNVLNDEIIAEAKRSARVTKREDGNFEDQLRAANVLLQGLEILTANKENEEIDNLWKKLFGQATQLRTEIVEAIKSFATSILEGERKLIKASPDKQELAFNYLQNFLQSFASRSGTRERLNIFTTNYDRYIEIGADMAGLRLIDRFVGTLMPLLRSSRLNVDLHYNPPGIRGEPRYLEGVAHYAKLHGSVDWVDCDGMIRRIGLPFGAENIQPYLASPDMKDTDAMRIMIYPNAGKDRETLFYPYAELFRDFAAAICQPNSTLFCYGYSFGDEHINRVIEDMLTILSSHLVIMSYSDPLGRIMKTYEKLGRPAQITLLLGDYLGDLKNLVDHYLPKPAIDRTTFRMADLLKSRLTTGDAKEKSHSDGVNAEGDTKS